MARIVWTESTARLRAEAAQTPRLSPSEARQAIASALALAAEQLREGVRHGPEHLRADTARALELAREPGVLDRPLDPRDEVLVFRACTDAEGSTVRRAAFAVRWVELGGLAHAIRCAARAGELTGWQVAVPGASPSRWGLVIRGASDQDAAAACVALELVPLARRADEGARVTARDAIAGDFPSFAFPMRCVVAAMLDVHEWIDACARERLSDAGWLDVASRVPLFASIRDPATFEAVLDAFPHDARNGAVWLGALERVRTDVVARRIVRALEVSDGAGRHDRWTTGEVKAVAEVAANVDDEGIARWMARHGHVKNLQAIATEYFVRLPHHVPLLERLSHGSGPVAEGAATILEVTRRRG